MKSFRSQIITLNALLFIAFQADFVWLQVASNESALAPTNTTDGLKTHNHLFKCNRQSIILARQVLNYELNKMNDYLAFWFNDLDKDELLEQHKQSLSNIVMSGLGRKLLNSYGQPLVDIESSYFRQARAPSTVPVQSSGRGMGKARANGIESFADRKFAGGPLARAAYTASSARELAPEFLIQNSGISQSGKHMTLRLLRRYHDKCLLNLEKHQYTYAFALSFGPFEHHLDVVYNIPRDLSLSQPIEWHYAQVSIVVPRMSYEIVLKQSIDASVQPNELKYRLETLPATCPAIEIKDVIYAQQHIELMQLSIKSQGLAVNNQTQLQIERLFDDYTRPAITQRLKRMLQFYLSNKTLPLSAIV